VASKAQRRLLQRKEAKQKKILFVLVPVFLGLLVWQGPGILSAFTGGGDESSTPPAATTTSETGAAAEAPAAPPPPNAAAPGAQPPALAAGEELPDTDVPAQAGEGQLFTFSRFVGKDPFKQQLRDAPSASGTSPPASPPAASPAAASPPPPPPPASSAPEDTEARATTARIDVNGSVETVRVRGTFPAGDPVFRLVSIRAGAVRIGLVAGSFEGGAKTVDVGVGERVVLVSQPDGVRYRIRVVYVGT
jgi:hypothetical protein